MEWSGVGKVCGISGLFNRGKSWREDISRMNTRMIHRGPDAQNFWTDETHNIVLGHVRLSIVDLSDMGSQPMVSHDGRYVMVLNGEIYNYEDMRKKLNAEGKEIEFRGHSDTEVLLEYVAVHGFREALKESIGMFAVGVYDRRLKKLYLGRDRIGEKPLYCGFVDNEFVFSSDLGSISDIAKRKLQIDYNVLSLYFKFGYIPAPYTIYKGIEKVEAGSIVEMSYPFREKKTYKYWNIMDVAKYGEQNLFVGSEKEAADKLEELLKQAIRRQMVADVPVGAFLSGGIDSSTVVAIMQSLSQDKIKTFSIGFENHNYNEATFAKESAEFIGTEHTQLYVTSKDVVELIPKMPHIYSEPFADSSQLPTYLVSRLAKEKVTVSLSGDGGDELFCGYNSYNTVVKIWEKIGWIPFPVRNIGKKIIKNIRMPEDSRILRMGDCIGARDMSELYDMFYSYDFLDKLVLDGKHLSYKHTEYPTKFLQKSDVENVMLMDLLMYHPDDILVKVDRSGMAVSLESRIPMLDRDIVEFAFTLPHRYKVDQHIQKKVLRNVLYRYMPKIMVDRPKKGFAIPVMEWIRNGELIEWAEDMLADDRIKKQNILNPGVVKMLWENFKKTGKRGFHVWSLLMFEEWMETC